ncbi:MAG TPA: hypothetical protein PK514_15300 [Spirochaetota bacterium]|nr:hypothetical protein [Spirochaetota bacterium]
MKQLRLILTVAIFLTSSGLYAQMVNLMNMSAEWARTGNRNAAIDAADIVFYNPAGLTKLEDGIHFNISNQTLIRLPEHTADFTPAVDQKRTFKHEGVDWFLPNAYLAYKKNNWAVFTGFFIPAGGVTVNYPDGSLNTEVIGILTSGTIGNITDQSLEASSIYLAGMLGGTYAINEMFSFAAGIRYVNAKNTTKGEVIGTTGTVNVKTEDTADGFGGVIGINITPIPELNIGMRYETITKLEFETDVKKDTTDLPLFVDGAKSRSDIPAVFAIGALYAVTPELSLELDFNYYFQKHADWDRDLNGKDYAESAGDCFTTGLAAIYKVNSMITASAGFTYSYFMWEDEDSYYTKLGAYETLFSDNIAFLIGAAVEVAKGVKVNLAYNFTWWEGETIEYTNPNLTGFSAEVKTRNTAHVIAVGADCSF